MEKKLVDEIFETVNSQEVSYEELQELEEVVIPATGGGCGLGC